jgi:hypothetical protein
MRSTRILLAITFFFGLISLALLVFLLYRGINRPQSAVPSKASEGDVTKCQGNTTAPAKCFDCKKDTSNDQVNILDFSCFQKFYGQDVGTQ